MKQPTRNNPAVTLMAVALAATTMGLALLAPYAHNGAQAQHGYIDPSPAGQECVYARLYSFTDPQPLPPGCTAIGATWDPGDGATGIAYYVCPVINEGRCQWSHGALAIDYSRSPAYTRPSNNGE